MKNKTAYNTANYLHPRLIFSGPTHIVKSQREAPLGWALALFTNVKLG